MTDNWIVSLSARQLQDYRNREPGTYFGEGGSLTEIEDAYRVSVKLSELRQNSGDTRAGYKVGCTSPSIFEAFGIRGPVFGFLYAQELRACGARLKSTDFRNLAIEAEMAIKVGQDLQVESVFPIIELHNLLFRGATNTLQELVANNCFNAGVVMPNAISNESDAECIRLGLEINGEAIEEGHPWCFPGGASESLSWISQRLGQYGLALTPGDIVLAGTNLGIHRVNPGDKISVLLNAELRVESEVLQ